MKIKIITCHDVYNAGASLQAYALMTYLEGLGHEVEIIDYKPAYLRKHYSLSAIQNPLYNRPLIRELYLIAKLPGRIKARKSVKKRLFDEFRDQYLHLTKQRFLEYQELKDNCPDADLYIAGSDQIWNPGFANGHDPAFYLQFVDSGFMVSYAASIAVESIDSDTAICMKTWLQDFDEISVREETAVKQLGEMGVQAERVCDPVFLINVSDWLKMAHYPKEEGYIFLCDFDGNNEISEAVRAYALKTDKTVISPFSSSVADQVVSAGPLEFLGYIANADMIVSNSFHAFAFSLMFHKDFYIFNRNEDLNVRLHDLIERLSLKERLIAGNALPERKRIDWERIDKLLWVDRDRSVRFLDKVLRSADEC